jgi:hypothetical protein
MEYVWMNRETQEVSRGRQPRLPSAKHDGWLSPPDQSVPGQCDSGVRKVPLPGERAVGPRPQDERGLLPETHAEALALWRHKDGQVLWYATCARCWDLPDEVLHAKWLAKRASS